MEKIEQNRWKINKIGLLNYWWYDEEEFEFQEGRMILRGTNGSGKSVTMQSFIPLLLDGKKTPERLDPFGNKARKIEDYVLGYGDDIKEENTSYLYMEFCKKETQNYLTIGMGLRGKKGQGVKFWGFVIKDGRRIGKDIFLYKDVSNKIPLTKLELKNRIGQGGEIVETQKEYAELVNNNVFGFETLEEYDEFIKLLIEIRTPKLSNGKGFRPSTVIEILSNSLRPLSDEDLRPVSESIDNMNKTKEQLEFLKQSKKAINKIKGYYQTYNQYLLYSKAKTYQEENKNYQNSQLEQENLEQSISQKEQELSEVKKKIQDLDAKIKAVELQEEALRNSKAWNLQKELSEIEETLKGLQKEISEKQEKIEKQERDERNKETEIKKEAEEYNLYFEEFKEKKQELADQATEIDYDEYFFRIDEIEENIHAKYNFNAFQADIKRYIEKIETAKKALERLKETERNYDQAINDLEIVKNNKTKQEAETTKLRLARDEERSKMTDQMYEWEKQNEILKLTNEEKTKIAQKIENYGAGVSYDDILSEVRTPFGYKQDAISKELVTLNYQKQEIQNQIDKKQQEKQEWQNQKDPEPIRDEKVQENRENLKKFGIHFIPFYQAIDFKTEVEEKTKGIIESALKDMGILDSLLIPEKELEKATQIDTEFVDKYLVPKPVESKHNLTEFLKVDLPENSGLSQEQVINTLKTILINDKTSQNYIGEKGYYQIGLVQGKTSKNQPSKFIGQESRKNFRIQKIAELEHEIQELEIEKQEKENQEEKQKVNLAKLKEELQSFPAKDEVETKDNQLKVAIQGLEAIKLEIVRKEELAKEKYEKLKQAKLETEEKTAKMRFAVKLEAYEQAEETANGLKENLYMLEKIQNNLVNTNQKQEILQENLEEIRNNLDDLRYDASHLQSRQRQAEESKKTLKEMLEKEGNNLSEQMDECLRLKKDLPIERNNANKQEGRLETEIETQKEKLLNIAEKVVITNKKKEIAKDIFKQELKLGYLNLNKEENQEQELNKTAKEIIRNYNYFEKQNKDKSSYLDSFVIQVRDNHEYLIDYNLSIETIFNEEIEEIEDENQNSEITSLLQTRARRDITCFVKGRKVNFLTLSEEVDETIKDTENLIEEDDRKLFEEILTNTVGRKIRERIYHAKSWVYSMNQLMETIDTSSKLSFSLNWRPKPASEENEIDTRELVNILNSDGRILRQEEITKVANHFRTKFAKAEAKVKEIGGATAFHDIMKETLDYRTWFEFQFNYKKGTDTKKELTNNAFFKLSGGEKAMAMYIPLFAAVTSKFQSAKEMAPRIISLDEAFAGVDDANIRDMFRILTKLELEYVINSQVLWGEYDTIPSLAINELVSDPEFKVVSVIRYRWNGKKRELII